jgi:hypothetical protein
LTTNERPSSASIKANIVSISERSAMPVSHAGFLFPAFERPRDLVVPASLAHKFIPDINPIFGRLPARSETPTENFFVGSALFHALDQLIVIDS